MGNHEESTFRGLVTSWPALVAMAITVLSFLAAKPNLESPRPTSVGAVAQEQFRGVDVQARLWQDPLGSVLNGPFHPGADNLTNGRPEPSDGVKKVLVLLAVVDMNLNPENVETRRRERFATLAALNTAGYVPVKSERISYVDLTCATSRPAPGSPDRYVSQTQSKNVFPQLWKGNPQKETRARLAFEWLRPLGKKEAIRDWYPEPMFRGVCVVWVWDDIAPDNSLRSFAFLKDTIQKALHQGPGTPAECDFAISGRIASDQLGVMRRDDDQLAGDKGSLNGVTLYVTNSTAASVRGNCTDETLPNSKLHLQFVIGSDDLLLRQLLGELQNRGVSTAAHHIALVSEWDTAYGRAMPQEFLRAAGIVDHAPHAPRKPDNIFLYTYLRGIDGKLPVKTEAADEDKRPAKETKPAESSADKPSTVEGEGDAQVDYVRRLIERMKAEHAPFRAIGVLGSDTYDKLLLLRVLRPAFPQAILFTTDLDARLLGSGDYAATRNVVLASHFGQALDPRYQQGIPPFRSSYDTASYLGSLLAVQCPLLLRATTPTVTAHDAAPLHHLVVSDKCTMPLPIHLYEVGRYGAFELTVYTPEEDPLGPRNLQRDLEHFQHSWWHLVVLPLIVLLLGVLLITVSRTWQRLLWLQPVRAPSAGEPAWHWRTPLLGIGVLVAVLLTSLMLYSHYHPHEEPFSMVDGLSLWPTIAFRIFAIALCVYYAFTTLEDLARRNHVIRTDFGFTESGALTAPSLDERGWLPKRLQGTIGMWLWCPNDDKEKVADAWQQFEAFGRVSNRLYRCAMVLAVNVALFILLYSLVDTTVFRGRGTAARVAGRLSLDLAGIALVGLLILVVDTTVSCYRFVSYLGRCRYCGWSDTLIAQHAAERALEPTTDPNDPARSAITELLRIRLIAAATYVVARLIFDPFVVLLVLVVAQSPLFVPWQWNIPALTIAFLSATAALACALILQRSAKQAQARAIATLDRITLPLIGQENAALRDKVAKIRDEIDAMDSGAFAGFSQNPVVYALLLPLGGGGGLAALEALLPHL
jgi:hypothetical protein